MIPAMRFLTGLCVVLIMTASVEAQRRDRLPRGERDRREQPVEIEQPRTDAQREADRTLPYLAYTLGELHYLAFACEGMDAQEWRTHMLELLEMEAPNRGRRRDRLIEAFNDGYRVQQRYRPVCGPEVEAERRALAHRGRDLSEMMRAAYFD